MIRLAASVYGELGIRSNFTCPGTIATKICLVLWSHMQPAQAFANAVKMYSYYTLDREFARPHWTQGIRGALAEVRSANERVGTEGDWLPAALEADLCITMDVSASLGQLRRAKVTIGPGVTECEVYSAIKPAMVQAARTSVELHGDFARVRAIGGGGPPSERRCGEGNLFVLAFFTNLGGYVCDLCRTLSEPSREQMQLWKRVSEAQAAAATLLRPGARCPDIYEHLRSILDAYASACGSFTHHTGGGVRMDGWRLPWLTPGSDRVLIDNEVIACEPGLYREQIGAGVRLEHNCRIGATRAVPLDSFPLELRYTT